MHMDEHLPSPAPTIPPGNTSGANDLGRFVAQTDGLARDRLLGRQVTAERVDSAHADDLLERARFLARLAHPGIVVVHDCLRGDGGALLVCEPPPGPTLAEAVGMLAQGAPHPRLASTADVAVLFIKLGDAIAATHARGVVHGALDAGCVRLGLFGETAIGAWEPAMTALAKPMTLRFVSGQAPNPNLSLDGRHDDLRSLGRMMLAALRGRPDGAQALEPLDPAEVELVPEALERIARHAAVSDAAAGYQTAEEFVADLRLVLAGQLPRLRAGLIRRGRWWLGRHAVPLAAAVALALAAAGAAWYTWGRGWLEDRSWLTATEETFADEGWRTRWVEKAPRSFEVVAGRLVSSSPRDAVLVCRRRLSLPLVVEYTGRVEPGSQACDLSLLWSESDRVPEVPERIFQGRGLQLQLGAFDNSFSAIISNPGMQRLAHSTWRLEEGRDYRIRVELEGERHAVFVDDRLLLEGRSLVPLTSGYLALYSYYPGKSFDDVRIRERRQPAAVSPLVGGNTVFALGLNREAAIAYGAVADAQAGTALGEEAAYRRGLAERLDGRMDAARASWAALKDPLWSGLAECHQLEDISTSWQHDRFAERFEVLYRERPALRYQLRLTWQSCLQRVSSDVRREAQVVDTYLELRERLFPDDATSRYVAAWSLILTRRPQRVLDEFADDRQFAAIALLILGRADELLAAPWAIDDDRWGAHTMRGEYDQALALPRTDPQVRARILAKQGKLDEALALAPDSFEVLLLTGRAAQALEIRPLSAAQANVALLVAGRPEEAAGTGLPGIEGSGNHPLARLLLGLPLPATVPPGWRIISACESADAAAVRTALAALPAIADRRLQGNVFSHAVIAPMARRAIGEAEEPQRTWRATLDSWRWQHGQRMWYLISFAMGGQADLSGLPAASESEAWTAVGLGLRAEMAGSPAAAVAAYKAFAALPMHRRLLDGHQPDLDVEGFVAWRLRQLGKP